MFELPASLLRIYLVFTLEVVQADFASQFSVSNTIEAHLFSVITLGLNPTIISYTLVVDQEIIDSFVLTMGLMMDSCGNATGF